MRAAIRHLLSLDIPDLVSWKPDELDFAIGIRLLVGPEGAPGEESFDLTICTPGWLAQRVRDEAIVNGRHHLVVETFDYRQIELYLRGRVAACDGASWEEIAPKLARLGHWEFEDYRP